MIDFSTLTLSFETGGNISGGRMISLVQASITSTSGLLLESVRIWFFLSPGSTIKKLWGCQEGLRAGWHRIGDGVDAGAGTARGAGGEAGKLRLVAIL